MGRRIYLKVGTKGMRNLARWKPPKRLVMR